MKDKRPKGYYYWEQLMEHMSGKRMGPADIFENHIYPRQLEIHLPSDKKTPCPFHCSYCHAKNTMVLMDGMYWKPIQDIKVGEYVIGLEHQFIDKLHRWKYVKSKVIDTFQRKSEIVELKTDKVTTYCTPDHKWLRRDNRYDETMKRHSQDIKFVQNACNPINNNQDYKLGWINGVINGDGCIVHKESNYTKNDKIYKNNSYSFRIGVKDKEIIDRIILYLPEINFTREMRGKYSYTPKEYHTLRTQKKDNVKYIKNICEDFNYNSNDFCRGFLGGIFDAEGSYSRGTITFGNTDTRIFYNIKFSLDFFGIKYTVIKRKIKSGKIYYSFRLYDSKEIIKFFSLTNPSVKRKTQAIYGKSLYGRSKILSVKNVGQGFVFNIETETGNYIANGLVSKNCAGKHFIKDLGNWELNGLKLLNEIGDKIKFNIHGGSYTEPINNPYLMSYLATCKSFGNHFGIHTSGFGLKQMEETQGWLTELNRIATDKIDYLSYSLDAGSVESHKRTKGLEVNYFDDILESIEMAVELSKKGNKPAVRVCYLMNTINSSDEEIASIVKFVRDIGTDSLRFSIPFASYGQDFDKVRDYRNRIEQTRKNPYYRKVQPYLSDEQRDGEPFIFWMSPDLQDVELFNFKHCAYGYYQICLGADGFTYKCTTVSTPTFQNHRLGKTPNNLEMFNEMIKKNQDENFNAIERCFKCNARGNRMALEINLEYDNLYGGK